jgi:phosphate transport system protein
METNRHTHLSSEFEHEMSELRSKLLLMASKVEALIGSVIEALVERDSSTAEAVVRRDKEVDQLEKEVDELCIRILALRQPAASDLRRITTALKVVTDLERMGDLCVNIAKAAMKINREPQVKPLIDIPNMATMVRDMVRRSLDSFVNEDTDLATKTVCADKDVDAVNDQVFRELLTYMIEKPATIGVSTHLIFVARHLERIADHATNIAEQVIFMVMGDDVRHEKAKLRAAMEALESRGAESPDHDATGGRAHGPLPDKG